jgi:hypothetical protein
MWIFLEGKTRMKWIVWLTNWSFLTREEIWSFLPISCLGQSSPSLSTYMVTINCHNIQLFWEACDYPDPSEHTLIFMNSLLCHFANPVWVRILVFVLASLETMLYFPNLTANFLRVRLLFYLYTRLILQHFTAYLSSSGLACLNLIFSGLHILRLFSGLMYIFYILWLLYL